MLHRWLDSLPEPVAVQVRSSLDYLTEFGRAAQLDDVRHRIQSSRHYPDMSEVRVLYRTTPHDLVLRVLTVFTNNDQTLVVCIGGDKAAWQRTMHSDWYDHAIPVADQIFDIYQQNPF
jgi:hypothetical protein